MPQGWLKQPIDNLRTLLAASAEFQSVVGAGDATGALDSIYKWDIPRAALRPLALVTTNGERSIRKTATATWSLNGALCLLLEFPVGSGDSNDHQAAGDTFAAHIEQIIEDMAALAGTDTYLNVIEFTEAVPPLLNERDNDEEAEDYWWTAWELEVQG